MHLHIGIHSNHAHLDSHQFIYMFSSVICTFLYSELLCAHAKRLHCCTPVPLDINVCVHWDITSVFALTPVHMDTVMCTYVEISSYLHSHQLVCVWEFSVSYVDRTVFVQCQVTCRTEVVSTSGAEKVYYIVFFLYFGFALPPVG